ncbi:hypothetical protein [Methanothermobacter sp. DP]|uniref:hypothetical protein n=1 Tax=Methanothermobacter sp. DP TaxID=2998972 RepID=UPI002AA5443F|nr:hypothetical protein [Methanothermobacter sp. DP]
MFDERRFLGLFTVLMVISFLYVLDVHGASEFMVFLLMLTMLSLYGYRTSNQHKGQLKIFVETVLTALLYIILVLQPALNTLNWYVAIILLTTLLLVNTPQLKPS